jgi:hypothetical protein
MPKEIKGGCARPTGGVVEEKEKEKTTQTEQAIKKEEQWQLKLARNTNVISVAMRWS